MDLAASILTIVGTCVGVIMGLLIFVYNTAKNANESRREWQKLRIQLVKANGESATIIERHMAQENLDYHSWYGSWFNINSFLTSFVVIGIGSSTYAAVTQQLSLEGCLIAFCPLSVGLLTLVSSHIFMIWSYNHEMEQVFQDSRRHRYYFPVFWQLPHHPMNKPEK